MRGNQPVDIRAVCLLDGNPKEALRSRIEKGESSPQIVFKRSVGYVIENLEQRSPDILYGVLEGTILACDAIEGRSIPPNEEC